MAVKFQDYYETLGVKRDASQDEIQRAYRKLARKYHPDVNKESGAEERFRKIGEAYEVLKDPDRRKRYDQLGADWKSGQDFQPPPGWEGFGGRGPAGGRAARGRAGRRPAGAGPDVGGFEGFGGFSDFFEAIFGGAGGAAGGGGGFGGMGGMRGGPFAEEFVQQARGRAGPRPGEPQEAEITIPVQDAYRGATRSVTLEQTQYDDQGRPSRSTRTFDVRIPPGTTEGSVIRLAGQGSPGFGGGPPGDLLMRVHIAPDPRFKVNGHDLQTILPVAPWEAALGAKVPVPTLDGEVTMTIPPGSQSGSRLRLRGKGLPKRGKTGERGDQYVELRTAIPTNLTDAERSAWEQLRSASNFDPRRA